MPGQKITLVLQHPIVRSRVMVETQTESSDRSRVLMETRTDHPKQVSVPDIRKDVMMGQKITLIPFHPVREFW